MPGYNSRFLGTKFSVRMPDYSKYGRDVAINNSTGKAVLDYIYYSVVQSKSRRVPIISASNIYRIKFDRIDNSGSFKKESRIADEEQLTAKDYKRFNTLRAATIEKGHMTKREDVQWDINGNKKDARLAANSTFYYPNAVPQHDALNNGPWKHLENSVIIKGRVPEPAKVSVFTGPVLDERDPTYKTGLAEGSPFKIPVLFWKVIYYLMQDGKLYKAGFLMGQLDPLRRDQLIDEVSRRELEAYKLQPFLEFKDDENYQVPVTMIEKLTKLKFAKAIDRHADIEPTVLTLQNVQIRPESTFKYQNLNFEVEGLVV